MLSRQYHFKFFKDCLSQTLHGLFLNTLSHTSDGVLNAPENGHNKNALWESGDKYSSRMYQVKLVEDCL